VTVEYLDLADYLAIAEEVTGLDVDIGAHDKAGGSPTPLDHGGLAGVGVEVPHEAAATNLGGLSDGVVRMVSAVR
jgi:hypothetical protein